MKIIHIIQGMGNGGAERLCVDISNEINDNHDGYEILILILSNVNDYPKLTKNLKIKSINVEFELSMIKPNRIKLNEYENIIDEFKPDVIHSHLYTPELISRENIRKNIKYITHVHSNFEAFRKFELKHLFNKKAIANFYEKRRIFKKYLKSNNTFITISRDTDKNIKLQLPKQLHKNIHLLHNAINLETFNNKKRNILQKEERLNLISVGTLRPIKNHIFQIYVLKKIIENGIDCQLYLIGDGSERSRLEELISELNLKEKVFITGYIENVKEYLDHSDIYIHTAYHEGLSLTTIEALASGLPVVCLDAYGNRDLIENGENGFLLAGNTTPKEFASKIICLYNAPDRYEKMSENANRMSKQYDIRAYVQKLLGIYSNNNNKFSQ